MYVCVHGWGTRRRQWGHYDCPFWPAAVALSGTCGVQDRASLGVGVISDLWIWSIGHCLTTYYGSPLTYCVLNWSLVTLLYILQDSEVEYCCPEQPHSIGLKMDFFISVDT